MHAAGFSPSTLHLKVPRYGAAAAVVGTHIYVIGGSTDVGYTGSIERVDLLRNQARVMRGAITARRYLTAEAVDSRIYITGGYNDSGLVSLLEIYDPLKDEVSLGPPIPTPRYFASSAVIGGNIYVAGGSFLRGDSPASATVEIFNVAAGQWESGPSLSVARQVELVALNGSLFAIGGYDGSKATRIVEVLESGSDTWRRLSDLPFPMSAHRAATAGGRIYTFGDYHEMNRVWVYNPDDDMWDVLVTDYLPARHAAATTINDTVVIIGGNISTSGTHLDYIQQFSIQSLQSDTRLPGVGPWTPRRHDVR